MTGARRGRELDQVAQTDLSFEIWREIFRVVAENEKKALATGETVALTLAISQGVAHNQSPILCIEIVCAPDAPARFQRVPIR